METKFVHFAGVDVSKQKIDVCVIVNNQRSEIVHNQFEQSKKGFASLKKWLVQVTARQTGKLLICVENTGLYDDALMYYLSDHDLAVSLENAATSNAVCGTTVEKQTSWMPATSHCMP